MILVRLVQFSFVGAVLLMVSCSTTKSQFGETILETNAADTSLSKQAILNIKALDNNVFDSATFFGKEKIKIKYRLFRPNQTKKNVSKYPLVVVFHSSGKPIGSDNRSQLGLLAKLFASPGIQKKYPAYVLAPQFATRSSDYLVDSARSVLTSSPRRCLQSALQLIDSLKPSLNIDTNRIYVVGYSMGGSTVINSIAERPGMFAAGISISGIPQFDTLEELAATPVWLIHGIDDTENPINSDDQFYKEKNSNNRIRFWRLKNTTHDNIFSIQLLGETLPKWLFKIQRE